MRAIRPVGLPHPVDPKRHWNRAEDTIQDNSGQSHTHNRERSSQRVLSTSTHRQVSDPRTDRHRPACRHIVTAYPSGRSTRRGDESQPIDPFQNCHADSGSSWGYSSERAKLYIKPWCQDRTGIEDRLCVFACRAGMAENFSFQPPLGTSPKPPTSLGSCEIHSKGVLAMPLRPPLTYNFSQSRRDLKISRWKCPSAKARRYSSSRW